MILKSAALITIIIFIFPFKVFCTGTKKSNETNQKVMCIAILDFKSPTKAPWLGAALSESLITRLLSVRNLRIVERKQINKLISSVKNSDITAKMVGCDYLLTGSVQVIGELKNKASKVRLSTRLISAETGSIKQDSAIIINGNGNDLFALESELAEKLGNAIGTPLTLSQSQYHEEQSYLAKQYFGEGLLKLDFAETDILNNQADESTLGTLQEAVGLFRKAQKENQGIFYSRAHHYEAYSRELIANQEKDKINADRIRNATIEQFRKDAGRAAPAFYDLGRAYEANNDYENAISSYNDFRKWISAESKILNWENKSDKEWQRVFCARPEIKVLSFEAQKRTWTASKSHIISFTWGNFVRAYSLNSGKLSWEIKLPGTVEFDSIECVMVVKSKLYAFINKNIIKLDIEKGEIEAIKELPLRVRPVRRQDCKSTLGYFNSKSADVLILKRLQYYYQDGNVTKKNWGELVALDAHNLEILWVKKRQYLYSDNVWLLNNSILYKDRDGKLLIYDVITQKNVEHRFSKKLLNLLPFEYNNNDEEKNSHTYFYPGVKFPGWIVRFIRKTGRLKSIWKINAWDKAPEKINNIHAVIQMHHMDGYILNFFGKIEDLPEKLTTLAFDMQDKKGKIITLPKKAAKVLQHPETWQWNPLIFMFGNKIISLNNDYSVYLYKADQTFDLLWKYHSLNRLWSTPYLINNKICLVIKICG